VNNQIPTVVDLFAGCGGLSTGLMDAGYRVLAGIDNDIPSMVAFDYNHQYRGAEALPSDIRELTGRAVLEHLKVSKLELLAGGPPCQPFSIAGKRRGLSDPRGKLLGEFLRLVGEIQPTAVLLENVPALVTAHSGDVLREIESELGAMGYRVVAGILNAADYGVPQNRKRLFVIAHPKNRRMSFPPPPTHTGASGSLFGQPHVTCRQALDDLPDVETPEAQTIPNHEPTSHTPAMLRAFADLAPGRREPSSYHDRLHPDRPGYTLRAGSGNFSPLRPVHYRHDRVITVRESARLQGLPDHFIWPDALSRLQQYRQVGNAVPPPLARAIGEHLAASMGWQLDPGSVAGDPNTRPPAFMMTPEERDARRKRFQRGGASDGVRERSA
jgi:DNA (cytosine-5)-methyltransferase 1